MILGKTIIQKQINVNVPYTIAISLQALVIKEIRNIIILKMNLRNLSNLTLR